MFYRLIGAGLLVLGGQIFSASAQISSTGETNFEVPIGTVITCKEQVSKGWGKNGEINYRLSGYRVKKVNRETVLPTERQDYGYTCSPEDLMRTEGNRIRKMQHAADSIMGSELPDSYTEYHQLARCYQVSRLGREPEFFPCIEVYKGPEGTPYYQGIQCDGVVPPFVLDKFSVEANGQFYRYLSPVIPLEDTQASFSRGLCTTL